MFESLGSIAPALFDDQNKYQLFAKQVWPVLARCREQLAECYASDNGRPAVEPSVYFCQRLLEHAKSDLAFGAVLEALQAEELVPKCSRQRLDSTQHRKRWVGYKVQVAETLPQKRQPPFLVSVVTQKATESDEPGLDQMLEERGPKQLGTAHRTVCRRFLYSGARAASSRSGRLVVGGPGIGRPHRAGVDRLPVEVFTVEITERRARCPARRRAGHRGRVVARKLHPTCQSAQTLGMPAWCWEW